ncbi:MAG: PRC-barrel domain-containing protein [Bacillota bacterium]
MIKGRELLGLPVQSKQTGEVLGRIRDFLVDTDNMRLVALILKDGSWLREPEVIPIEDILEINKDGLISGGDQGPTCLEGLPELKTYGENNLREMAGSPVVTTGGTEIGTFQDLLVDASLGSLTGMEISGGLVSDLLSGRATITIDDVVSFASNKLIVKEELKNLWDQENVACEETGSKEG